MKNGIKKVVKRTSSISSTSGWFEHSKLIFYGSVLLIVILGILLQLFVYKILFGNEVKGSFGKDLFSRPPLQQNLVRFPPDVSYFTPETQVSDDSSSEETDSIVTITTHDTLDARTVEKVKRRVNAASGKNKVVLLCILIYFILNFYVNSRS